MSYTCCPNCGCEFDSKTEEVEAAPEPFIGPLTATETFLCDSTLRLALSGVLTRNWADLAAHPAVSETAHFIRYQRMAP